mgnify:CR=1 FL=1
MTHHGQSAKFPTTCWGHVLAARDQAAPDARAALSELCAMYWYPLYAFIRRRGYPHENAIDLTQGYFARLLERGNIAAANPERGRFRSFLLTDCQRFLSHQRIHDRAVKRGGGIRPLSIDARDAEGRYLHEPVDDRSPERRFEHDWAVALLDGALARLRREYEEAGRSEVFEVLKVVLIVDAPTVPQAELARRLGAAEPATRVAIHRLRRRYRECVAATVSDPAEVDAEVQNLYDALGH